MIARFGVLLLAAMSLAFGLDPSRTLTQYAHRIWQTQQGLPQGTIYSILQTHDGYLWLGSQTGLIRFDGVRFEMLENTRPGAPSNVWARSAMEDSQHVLWIATAESGLFRMEGDRVTRYLSSDNVQCVAEGKDGDVWACTTNGIARIRDGQVSTFLPNQNIRAACEASDGTVWTAGHGPNLNSWDGAKFTSHRIQKLPADVEIYTLQCSRDKVWAGTTVGLLEISKSGERLLTSRDGLADSRVLCLAESKDGSLWIGTRNGFSRLRNGEIESYRPQEGLSQSTVYSMFEDVEGSLWVGTKNGLNQFLSGRALPYSANE